MGNNSSTILKEDDMEDYVQLLYLNRVEVMRLLKRFQSVGSEYAQQDLNQRFHHSEILKAFPELKVNPFQDRLFHVFSSQDDGCFSFEDVLDLFSALSDKCPSKVKALWAFKIFDFDNDSCIKEEDIMIIIDRLVKTGNDDPKQVLNYTEKQYIVECIVKDMDLTQLGHITSLEFVHAVLKMPEFSNCFQCKP